MKALTAAAVAATLLTSSALAQQTPTRPQRVICSDRTEMVDKLGQFGEDIHAVALLSEQRIVEIYVNDDTGTWTFITTDANGRSCVMGFGEGFVVMPEGDPV